MVYYYYHPSRITIKETESQRMKSPRLGDAGHMDCFFFFLTSDIAWEEEVPDTAWGRNLNIEKKNS